MTSDDWVRDGQSSFDNPQSPICPSPIFTQCFVMVTKTLLPSRQTRRNAGWPGCTFCSSRVTWLVFDTLLAVHFEDHVARRHARLVGRAVVIDVGHDGAAGVARQIEPARHVGRDRVERHAEVGRRRLRLAAGQACRCGACRASVPLRDRARRSSRSAPCAGCCDRSSAAPPCPAWCSPPSPPASRCPSPPCR